MSPEATRDLDSFIAWYKDKLGIEMTRDEFIPNATQRLCIKLILNNCWVSISMCFIFEALRTFFLLGEALSKS